NVAITLLMLGRLDEGLPLLQKAMAQRRKALGEDHPDTAEAYHNLGFAFQQQGKLAQALAHYEKALAGRRKVLGEVHPATASSYRNVGWCLNELGKSAEALRFLSAGLVGEDIERLDSAASGFDRSLFRSTRKVHPTRLLLAVALVEQKRYLEA